MQPVEASAGGVPLGLLQEFRCQRRPQIQPNRACQLSGFIHFAEFKSSAVSLQYKDGSCTVPLLLHRRRVSSGQAAGHTPVYSCMDCYYAFKTEKPRSSKWSLVNDLWIGRWPRFFSDANISHQMLLALARIVSTKVVHRPMAKVLRGGIDNENGWDFFSQQDCMVGSTILFPNTQCGNILHKFPPRRVVDNFAINFVVSSKAASTGNGYAHAHVSKIAKLKINKRAFDQQAARLMKTNPVYKAAKYNEPLVAAWVPRHRRRNGAATDC